jgi:hypothetical protein
MRPPPDNGAGRGHHNPGRNTYQQQTPPASRTANGLSVADARGGVVVDLADARVRRAPADGELPPGPAVCPPWCPWCYAPNWLGRSRVRRWRREWSS